MDSKEQSLFPRIVMGMVAFATLVAICWLFDFNMRKGVASDRRDFNLAGEWRFHNGALESTAPIKDFDEKILVPQPIRGQIKKELADEYWYQKTFTIPSSLEDGYGKVLFLGSIKGDGEVYWNGEKISEGKNIFLSITPLTERSISAKSVDLRVRIKRLPHLFPGLVHTQPVAIGSAARFDEYREFYFFDSGVKPLIVGALKLALFFLFAALFIFTPKKKEYFSFASFVFFAGLSSLTFSRYFPTYSDFYLRNSITFMATIFSFATIPWLSADVLRLRGQKRLLSISFGFTASAVALSASLWLKNPDLKVSAYQLTMKWLPISIGVPCIVYCAVFALNLRPELSHRRRQIFAFVAFLTVASLSWFMSGGSLLSFKFIPYPEVLDVALFVGLAICSTMDLRFSARRADRATLVVPKWFTGFLASGIDQVTLELPMVAVAVDTVGYTKILSELDDVGKSVLHQNIRARMVPVVADFGAQKLSDRGDGALFGWELSGDDSERSRQVMLAIAAAEHLITEAASSAGVKFRVGIAVGVVRGELKGGDISFLGEPLNAASRLEALAKPGTMLMHDSLLPYVENRLINSERVKFVVKGVEYSAMTLKKVA